MEVMYSLGIRPIKVRSCHFGRTCSPSLKGLGIPDLWRKKSPSRLVQALIKRLGQRLLAKTSAVLAYLTAAGADLCPRLLGGGDF